MIETIAGYLSGAGCGPWLHVLRWIAEKVRRPDNRPLISACYGHSMRSELLYTTVQGYIHDTYAEVELYDGAFLQVFGRGEGTIDWGGLTGSVEWTNFPPRRPDGVFLPDVTGVIRLAGHDRPVMYRMQGISQRPDREGRRTFSGPVRWYTDDPDLLWINDRWGFEEGGLDLETLRLHTRVFVIEAESPT